MGPGVGAYRESQAGTRWERLQPRRDLAGERGLVAAKAAPTVYIHHAVRNTWAAAGTTIEARATGLGVPIEDHIPQVTGSTRTC